MKKARLLIFAIALGLALSAVLLSGCTEPEHTHSFNEWHTVKEATCTEDGLEEQECACGEKNSRSIAAKGHKYENYVCLNCGKKLSKGLEYEIFDGNYAVIGIGTCTDTDINIPATYNDKPVTSIDWGAFSGCTDLASITIPDSVTSIGGSAFKGCTGLTSITIPNSVTSIDGNAFADCTGLTSITIPDSVTSIGDGAFYNTAYYNNSANWEDGVLYIGKYLIKVQNSVSGIKAGTKCIGNRAFYKCTGLTAITIPDSVTSIGREAFSGCTGLTSVTIGSGVTSIGNGAFYECTGLTSINIPDSVTSIGNSAFYGCTILYIIKNNSTLNLTIGSTDHGCVAYNAKMIINADGSVTYSGSNTYILTDDGFLFEKDSDNYWLIAYTGSLETVTLPKDINGSAYNIHQMRGVRNVIIPEGITSIGNYAFQNCTGLTSITIPDSVTSIGDHAFYNCTGLTSVTIGSGVTSIGESAFYNCTGLTSITIPDSVTSIGNYAFEDCTGLTSVTIGNGVTSIGDYVFSGYKGLPSITFNGTKAQWEAVKKGGGWNFYAGTYTVHCTDGDITA